jgi:hypothetical protein
MRVEENFRARIAPLIEEATRERARFVDQELNNEWHSFIPADYDRVIETLLKVREPGLLFLEWGSATGVIAIMADFLGFNSFGIEVDARLVKIARELAAKFGSSARFAVGSYLPANYEWISSTGDRRLGAVEHGPPGYAELGHELEDFDIVYGYPWSGEEPIMRDVMSRRGGRNARLLLNGGNQGMQIITNNVS